MEFFIYTHIDRQFKLYKGNPKKLQEIIKKDPQSLGQALELENIDGLLVLDDSGNRWYLAYSDSLGIVGQRTARRQADTIARSGFRMPGGYTIKGNYPMDEISDTNIGDLWKTVQQKYVISDLKGLAIDEETGLPSQLAERKQRLTSAGHKDALTEAKFELEEAEGRKRAMERSGEMKVTKKSPPKHAKAKIKIKDKKTKKPVAKKKKEIAFLEVDSVDKIFISGKLTIGINDPIEKTIIMDPNHLSYRQWSKIALNLEKDDLVQLTLTEKEDGTYATSLKT